MFSSDPAFLKLQSFQQKSKYTPEFQLHSIHECRPALYDTSTLFWLFCQSWLFWQSRLFWQPWRFWLFWLCWQSWLFWQSWNCIHLLLTNTLRGYFLILPGHGKLLRPSHTAIRPVNKRFNRHNRFIRDIINVLMVEGTGTGVCHDMPIIQTLGYLDSIDVTKGWLMIFRIMRDPQKLTFSF
jgi:hypothetical protein